MEDQSGTTSLVEYAAGTTIGSRREANEDAFGIFADSNIFVVADGCGGRSSGKSAANLTVANFARAHEATDVGPAEADPLARAVLAANADVLRAAQSDAKLQGQGATVCAVRVSPRTVSIVHVGDCRVGRCSDGRLDWLTEDHCLVSELRRSGAPPEEIARVAEVHSTVLTRAVGVRETLAVDLTYRPAVVGDLYLLCSDGLTRSVSQARISELLSARRALRERCTALLDESESAGGHDNATIVLLRLRS
jgi:serine/threonine protein phosphatase PrpC